MTHESERQAAATIVSMSRACDLHRASLDDVVDAALEDDPAFTLGRAGRRAAISWRRWRLIPRSVICEARMS